MPLDAISLRAVVEELRPQLLNLRIDKVQQPARDQAPPTGMVSVFSRAAGTSYNKGVAAEAAGADSGNANGRNPRRRFLPSQACRRAAISPSP